MPITHAAVTSAPIVVDELERLVVTPHDGAVASFVGRVRDHDPEAFGEVVQLSYTAHPDAGAMIEVIAAGALAGAADADTVQVSVEHRVGDLGVGDVALAVVAASAHRAAAFAACQAVVEAVKAELPVWKKQVERDGTHGWPGLGGSGA